MPGRRAIEQHDRRCDGEAAGDLGGHRRGRRQDTGRLADQAPLAASDERPEDRRQLHQAGRFGVQIGDVVDEPSAPAGRPADRGPGHRQGDQRLGVRDIGVRGRGGDRCRPRAAAPDRGQDLEAAAQRRPDPIDAASRRVRQRLRIGRQT